MAATADSLPTDREQYRMTQSANQDYSWMKRNGEINRAMVDYTIKNGAVENVNGAAVFVEKSHHAEIRVMVDPEPQSDGIHEIIAVEVIN
jgi:hypothetical protein